MDEKIEEIAKELCPHYDNGNCYYEVTEVSDCCCNCEFCWAVSQVLKAGYRKIPELPKDTVLTADDIAELLTIVARDTRKETAEKLINELLKFLGSRQMFSIIDGEHKTLIELNPLWKKVVELAKENGVEVKD